MNLTKSMFDAIRESMQQKSKSGGGYKDILKMEKGKDYLIRLLPNMKDLAATSYHYYHHDWKSVVNGQFTTILCPATWGDRCPICETRFKIWNENTAASQARARIINRKENWLINAYVISFGGNKDIEGTVKVLRMGKELHKIMDDAMNGKDKDQYGMSIFDFTDQGRNFRINVEAKSDSKSKEEFITYVSSKFLDRSAIPGMTPERAEELQNSLFKLDKMIEPSTPAKMKEMLEIHYLGAKETGPEPEADEPEAETPKNDLAKDDDDLPMGPTPLAKSLEAVEDKPAGKSDAKPAAKTSDDIDIDKLIEDL